MQIALLVPFGVNIKSEALHNRSLQSIDGHRGVERLQALPKDRPELSSGFGIVSERGDILAYSPTGDHCTSIRERHPLPLCQFAALGSKLKSVLLRKFHKSGRTGFLPNLESLFVADWIQEESATSMFLSYAMPFSRASSFTHSRSTIRC